MIRQTFAAGGRIPPIPRDPIVAVDIGNTNVKIAFPSGRLPESLEVLTFPAADGCRDALALLYQESSLGSEPAIWRIAPTGRFPWQELQAEVLQTRPDDRFEVIDDRRVPVPIETDEPAKVGIDRILAGFGAMLRHRSPAMLVADAGSAVTVDLILRGTFCGGAILPGLRTAAESFPRISGKLPLLTSFEAAPVYPGKNTEDAIHIGLCAGITGAIEQFFGQIAATLPAAKKNDALVVLSGGDAAMLHDWLQHSAVIPSPQIVFEPESLPLILDAMLRCGGLTLSPQKY